MLDLPRTGFSRERQLLGDPKATPPVPPIIPVGHTTLWEMVKNGDFPKPVKLSRNITAWRNEDVHKWIEEKGGES